MFDGGMGTMLQASGLEAGEIPELLTISNPKLITDIHKQYINAGSNVIYSCTFGANSYKLNGSGYTPQQVITAAIICARAAAKGTNTLVALDLGPIGRLMEPNGDMSFDDAYNYYKEQITAGNDADLIVFETMTDLSELKAAVLAAKENSNLPIVCTMTFEQNHRTFTGVSIGAMAVTLEGLGIDAIGVNCSLGPDDLPPIIDELVRWTNLPIVVKPNAGLPDPNSNTYSVGPDDFAKSIEKLIPYGVKIIGGCCGTTPQFIASTKAMLSDKKFVPRTPVSFSAVTSGESVVLIDRPRIIGERINPTGKKLFKEALKSHNIDYILTQGIEQVSAGADILDVNVGLPEIDEKEMMITVVKSLQGVTGVPLQIDTTEPDVLEAGLRVYNGKPIVNSVNGEEKSLSTVLPLVKKYGAAVVGLTLDENGIPKTAQGRFDIAKKIVECALKLGIERKDIYIDCLTLTASAEQEGVLETLNALERVKAELGVKTVLGVSNISFGLPNRELVNRTFLTMALQKGLDLPIINPNVEAMTGTVKAYNLLANIDKNSVEFISAYNNHTAASASAPQSSALNIEYAIEHGLKKEAAKATTELLATTEPMNIVNQKLIPALDKVGAGFEKGTIFLPQLIQAATAAQGCFDVIKQKLTSTSGTPVSRGKIILATVKGDIHDIGKNIVKVLLENYGYTVFDLGRDVPPEKVVETARENDIHFIGLSALMTTTLKSMEETIKLLHEQKIDCKTFVGGAVLTYDYAMKIGADYYCKDAKESVDAARDFFGE
nr:MULTISPECIES: homocysteine S-methyltransferase family protein [unclassified Ruminococcus]